MHLIPYPKYIEQKEGRFYANTYELKANKVLSSQVRSALKLLFFDMQKNGKDGCLELKIELTEDLEEDYSIDVGRNVIRVEGGERGVFYALQTLRQIVNTENSFPCCHIKDEPAFSVRGFHYDVTRGRVPTLEGLKKVADICAYLKINVLTLYFEHTFPFREFEGIVSKQERLEKEELIQFVEYCQERFIELIPTVAMFGHQYRLLQSDRYSYLCELENYQPEKHYWQERMLHHSIDISNPKSHELVKSFMNQMMDIFPSSYISPGVDETFDLCKGRNAGKNVQEAYCGFVGEICDYLMEHGRKALIYDDILLKYPSVDFEPENAIMLHWDYTRDPDEEKFKILKEKNVPFIAEPSVHSHGDVSANIFSSFRNITNLIDLAYRYGAKGIITTAWGDFGHFCDFNGMLCSLALGGGKSWNVATKADETFEKTFSDLFFGEKSKNIVDLLRELNRMHESAALYYMVHWYSNNLLLKNGKEYGYPSLDRVEKHITESRSYAEEMKRRSVEDSERTEIWESLGAAFGICEALNIMSNALQRKISIGCEEQKIIRARLAQFHEAWLRRGKEGEFKTIEAFFEDIIQYQSVFEE